MGKSLLAQIMEGNTVIWTNKYVKPDNYEYDEEGIIVTKEQIPFISVHCQPFDGYLIGKYGSSETLFYNIIAIKKLNPNITNSRLGLMVKYCNRLTQVPEDEVVTLTEEAKSHLNLPYEWMRYTNIWRAPYSKFSGQRTDSIKKELRERYISGIREQMPINTKWKTKEVSKESEHTVREVDRYWTNLGVKAKDRTFAAITESYEFLLNTAKIDHPTQESISAMSGISIRTIKTNWKRLLEAVEF